MSLSVKDKIKIRALVKQGWKIPEIHTLHYPKKSLKDIEEAVYSAVISISLGDRGSIGRIVSDVRKSSSYSNQELLDLLYPLCTRLRRIFIDFLNYYYIKDTS